jgi:hypothetical protein
MPIEAIPIAGMISGTMMVGFIVWGVVERGKQKMQGAPKGLSGIEARLARIEQAIDAMAVEVERISEGQRFTTRLLAERSGGAPVPATPASRSAAQ